MGFERAKVIINAATIGTGIKVMLRKGRAGAASMVFSIKSEIAKALGWAEGDKLEVLIGTDKDHGLLRFRKNNSSGDAVVHFKKAMKAITYATINLGNQPAFVNRAEAGRWCQHELVEDGYLEIVLPRWAEETGPKKQPVPAASPSSPIRPAPQASAQPRATVTGAVLGDPPPGRREMLAKMGDMKA